MSPIERVRSEILRLVKTGNHRACIRTQQLALLFNLPEKRIKQELATLAEQKMIWVRSWDGKRLRSYSEWPSTEEFINSNFGHLHLESPTAGEAP
jgi:uncharacterized protein YceH (UPF0502 family)